MLSSLVSSSALQAKGMPVASFGSQPLAARRPETVQLLVDCKVLLTAPRSEGPAPSVFAEDVATLSQPQPSVQAPQASMTMNAVKGYSDLRIRCKLQIGSKPHACCRL